VKEDAAQTTGGMVKRHLTVFFAFGDVENAKAWRMSIEWNQVRGRLEALGSTSNEMGAGSWVGPFSG
jgi:hypothetical protein